MLFRRGWSAGAGRWRPGAIEPLIHEVMAPPGFAIMQRARGKRHRGDFGDAAVPIALAVERALQSA
jgi:hypothetical protein